jgi:DNA invertase Pin-like site-specific DNA recombinase
MDYVLYMRVSTQQQGQSGLGLAAQKEIVLRFLGNSTILQEFIEVESGKNHRNRPELMKALELCKRKPERGIHRHAYRERRCFRLL